jgi:hypothetical protein
MVICAVSGVCVHAEDFMGATCLNTDSSVSGSHVGPSISPSPPVSDDDLAPAST